MRRILLIALLSAACSYNEEHSDITIHVAGIPATADHLDVVVTAAGATLTGKNCPSTVTATNAQCYEPAFPKDSLTTGSIDLAIAAPAASGTFTVDITARDFTQGAVATGSVGGSLPGPVGPLQVTLH
jgi:hypothetical protein